MDNVRISSLLRRYLAGRCSAEEEAELIEYITDHDDEEIRLILDDVWNNPEYQLPQSRSEVILDRILGRKGEIRPRRMIPTWTRIAATVALFTAAGIGIYQMSAWQTDEAAKALAENAAVHQFIKLPDGSTVLLNTGSTLDFPEAFDAQTREVRLSGEAFFNIREDQARPFVVHTGALKTTVLGTSFNVKAYEGEDNITVTVKSGRVKVSDERKVLGIINPDEQITFSRATQQMQQRGVKSEEVIAWAERDIFFDDVTMAEATRILAQRFSTQIVLENDNINGCRFTATFVQGEDLYQILDVICAFNGVRYVEESGVIRLSGAGCAGEIDEANAETETEGEIELEVKSENEAKPNS